MFAKGLGVDPDRNQRRDTTTLLQIALLKAQSTVLSAQHITGR
jgi:hypothetical protein